MQHSNNIFKYISKHTLHYNWCEEAAVEAHYIKSQDDSLHLSKVNRYITQRLLTCSLRWPDPAAPPLAAPPAPGRCLPSPPSAPAAGLPPGHKHAHERCTYSLDGPADTEILRHTHQPVYDGQQHVESLDPRFDIFPLWRQNHHRFNVPPWEVVVAAAWNTRHRTRRFIQTWTRRRSTWHGCWPTVKHCSAELRGGGQREAGVVELVAVVADADLKLDGVVDILEQGGGVKCYKERELPLPEKLLEENRWVKRQVKCATGVSWFVVPPPRWADHLMVGLQFCAPACPPALWLVLTEADRGTLRPPPGTQSESLSCITDTTVSVFYC